MFDTHAHLDDRKFNHDREEVINSLKENGITTLVNAASDLKSSKDAIALANKYDFIYASAGVHPHETKNMSDKTIGEIEKLLLSESKCVAPVSYTHLVQKRALRQDHEYDTHLFCRQNGVFVLFACLTLPTSLNFLSF